MHAIARDLTVAAIARRATDLRACGLETRAGIDRRFEAGRETSEVRIEFFRDGDLVDFVETHVMLDGESAGTPAELEEWLDECIAAVVAENGG